MELFATLNNNTLKLSVNTKEGFRGVTAQIQGDAVKDSQIFDVGAFSQQFTELLDQIPETKKKNLDLVFLLEPTQTILKFITVSKDPETDVDEQIIAEVSKKLEGVSLDDLYFSYQKIAPFVYQFVGVKKDLLEKHIELANVLGISLKGIVPWVLLLPKFLDSNDPSVFVMKTADRQTVALSELNGVYYCEDFDPKKDSKEILDLIEKLSVYNRTDPITKAYTVVDDNLDMGDRFEVKPALELAEDFAEGKGYEVHLIALEVLGSTTDYLNTQVNLLTILPVPVVQEKNKTMVYAGIVAGIAVLAVGGFGLFKYLNSGDDLVGGLALDATDVPVVLSEQDAEESSEEDSEESSEVTDENSLNKADLKIRVENGAGIEGIAGKTQTFLEEAGYTVTEIDNAEETGRNDTLVKFKSSKIEFKDLLIDDISQEYDVVVEEELDEDLEHDVLIIVGLN